MSSKYVFTHWMWCLLRHFHCSTHLVPRQWLKTARTPDCPLTLEDNSVNPRHCTCERGMVGDPQVINFPPGYGLGCLPCFEVSVVRRVFQAFQKHALLFKIFLVLPALKSFINSMVAKMTCERQCIPGMCEISMFVRMQAVILVSIYFYFYYQCLSSGTNRSKTEAHTRLKRIRQYKTMQVVTASILFKQQTDTSNSTNTLAMKQNKSDNLWLLQKLTAEWYNKQTS